ncbi:MAG: PEGA domain-containing protein [Polyangiaceae bacterium]|nr:PEGA domain-containing protein [Polyangiaceae bacterium]
MNGRSRRIGIVTLLLVLANSWVAPSFADEPPPAPASPQAAPPEAPDSAVVTRAKERKLEGDRAMDSLRYADALTAYNEAYALHPEPALLYNLGRTLEALDRLPEALEKLELFQSAAPPELLAKVPGLQNRIANIKKRTSQLTIKVNVEGARILVREAVAGKSPLDKPLMLKAGKASVLIEAEGYYPYQANVDLPGGGGYVLDAQLSSKEKVGRLIVRAPKSNVSVSLDGRALGQAPVETLADAGTHNIVARHPDHSDYATSVIVKAGEERLVMVTLGDPPVYKRWWFWTAMGAVVVGGTAATIVGLSERSPDKGDIAPYQLTPSFYAVSPVIEF